jgi:hypothetical protein
MSFELFDLSAVEAASFYRLPRITHSGSPISYRRNGKNCLLIDATSLPQEYNYLETMEIPKTMLLE